MSPGVGDVVSLKGVKGMEAVAVGNGDDRKEHEKHNRIDHIWMKFFFLFFAFFFLMSGITSGITTGSGMQQGSDYLSYRFISMIRSPALASESKSSAPTPMMHPKQNRL